MAPLLYTTSRAETFTSKISAACAGGGSGKQLTRARLFLLRVGRLVQLSGPHEMCNVRNHQRCDRTCPLPFKIRLLAAAAAAAVLAFSDEGNNRGLKFFWWILLAIPYEIWQSELYHFNDGLDARYSRNYSSTYYLIYNMAVLYLETVKREDSRETINTNRVRIEVTKMCRVLIKLLRYAF